MALNFQPRPQRRLTQGELDSFLEKAADLLRGGVDHSEFRGYVFALLFYKRINDIYVENVAGLERELGDPDLARDRRMHDFVVPEDYLWGKVARTTELDLGKALNDAMRAIERANEPKFDGILSNSTVDFNAQDRLPRKKLVDSAALRRWLMRQARESLVAMLERASDKTGLRFSRAFIKRQRTRWASCSRGRRIALNAKLLFLAPDLVEYSLIHELCHLDEMNHSKRFWALVERHAPGYWFLDRRLRDAWKGLPRWAS